MLEALGMARSLLIATLRSPFFLPADTTTTVCLVVPTPFDSVLSRHQFTRPYCNAAIDVDLRGCKLLCCSGWISVNSTGEARAKPILTGTLVRPVSEILSGKKPKEWRLEPLRKSSQPLQLWKKKSSTLSARFTAGPTWIPTLNLILVSQLNGSQLDVNLLVS